MTKPTATAEFFPLTARKARHRRKRTLTPRTVVGLVKLQVWHGQDPQDKQWCCPLRERWGWKARQQMRPALAENLASTATMNGSYEAAAQVAGILYVSADGTGLRKDKVQSLIHATRQRCVGTPQAAAVEQTLGYFVRNVSRMHYDTFRAAGYFIGSEVVEAGCQTIIGGRCQQSGLFGSESGAENFLARCCLHSSQRLEDFWEHRLHQHAARNDTLPRAARRKNLVAHPQPDSADLSAPAGT